MTRSRSINASEAAAIGMRVSPSMCPLIESAALTADGFGAENSSRMAGRSASKRARASAVLPSEKIAWNLREVVGEEMRTPVEYRPRSPLPGSRRTVCRRRTASPIGSALNAFERLRNARLDRHDVAAFDEVQAVSGEDRHAAAMRHVVEHRSVRVMVARAISLEVPPNPALASGQTCRGRGNEAADDVERRSNCWTSRTISPVFIPWPTPTTTGKRVPHDFEKSLQHGCPFVMVIEKCRLYAVVVPSAMKPPTLPW